jgi:hypothetical protein
MATTSRTLHFLNKKIILNKEIGYYIFLLLFTTTFLIVLMMPLFNENDNEYCNIIANIIKIFILPIERLQLM